MTYVYRKQLYGSVDELYPNFKGLNNGKQFNDLSNSDDLIVKAVPRFFYLAKEDVRVKADFWTP